jgi:hypothetical protein
MDLSHALEAIWNYTSDRDETGRCAWETVLDAVAAGHLAVDTQWRLQKRTLLHYAASNSSAAVMRRLLALVGHGRVVVAA